MLSDMDVTSCHELAVPMAVMQHVVRIESSNNPYAIGVVGGRLVRQPANLPEAVATARMLGRRGYNFSLGLAQVNRYNLGALGLSSYASAFQTCPNLQAGARILAECRSRAGNDWGKAFSCYYSGNFATGFRDGYVQKIFASMREARVPPAAAIGVLSQTPTPSRRPAAGGATVVNRRIERTQPVLAQVFTAPPSAVVSQSGAALAPAALPSTPSAAVAVPPDTAFVF